MLTCYSMHILSAQHRWDGGDRMGSLGGTTDPLPFPISCTNNMPHASRVRPILSSDRSSPALQPLRTTAWALPATCVEQPELLGRWSLNKFSARHWETSRSLGIWHFINHGINIYYWKKTARGKKGWWCKVVSYIFKISSFNDIFDWIIVINWCLSTEGNITELLVVQAGTEVVL